MWVARVGACVVSYVGACVGACVVFVSGRVLMLVGWVCVWWNVWVLVWVAVVSSCAFLVVLLGLHVLVACGAGLVWLRCVLACVWANPNQEPNTHQNARTHPDQN